MVAIENAYFPWIGALHSLLDSLVDHDEDIATGERALDRLLSLAPGRRQAHATIAGEALHRASALPQGRRHALILAAMTSFYLCELHRSASPHAQLIAPSVLEAIGGLAVPAMAILGARRSVRGAAAGTAGACFACSERRWLAPQRILKVKYLTFLFSFRFRAGTIVAQEESMPIRFSAHSVPCPLGGRAARPQTLSARVCGRVRRLRSGRP